MPRLPQAAVSAESVMIQAGEALPMSRYQRQSVAGRQTDVDLTMATISTDSIPCNPASLQPEWPNSSCSAESAEPDRLQAGETLPNSHHRELS